MLEGRYSSSMFVSLGAKFLRGVTVVQCCARGPYLSLYAISAS